MGCHVRSSVKDQENVKLIDWIKRVDDPNELDLDRYEYIYLVLFLTDSLYLPQSLIHAP